MHIVYIGFYQGETEHKNSQTFKRKKTDIIAEDYIEKDYILNKIGLLSDFKRI